MTESIKLQPDYNISRSRLVMPEYGRLVQKMVAHALTLETKELRQAYAGRIIATMEKTAPGNRGTESLRKKLWEHLAILANYKLDIDYPYPIAPQTEVRPGKLAYPGHKIRMRHYGHLIEQLAERTDRSLTGEARETAARLTAYRMKYAMSQWKGDTPDSAQAVHDLAAYTDGHLCLEASEVPELRIQPARLQDETFGRKRKKNRF
ncbi:MAG: DUF4290 domain-containing protein [Prevotellaceae bacterium]|nr:DUF4290 domain-containing protein [Prevotellaceae bacterium]